MYGWRGELVAGRWSLGRLCRLGGMEGDACRGGRQSRSLPRPIYLHPTANLEQVHSFVIPLYIQSLCPLKPCWV
jgi:hypothetical protein